MDGDFKKNECCEMLLLDLLLFRCHHCLAIKATINSADAC